MARVRFAFDAVLCVYVWLLSGYLIFVKALSPSPAGRVDGTLTPSRGGVCVVGACPSGARAVRCVCGVRGVFAQNP